MLNRPSSKLHPLWVLVLTVAMALMLLMAQSVGLLHRAAGPAAQSHTQSSVQHDVARHGGDFLGKLFAGHASDTDCQIFDQLSFVDAASALLAAGLSLALSSLLCTLLGGLACARWHAQFQARGPPFPR
jgi:hypothetical protein